MKRHENVAFKLAWPKNRTDPLGCPMLCHSSCQITISAISHPEPVVGLSPRQPVVFWDFKHSPDRPTADGHESIKADDTWHQVSLDLIYWDPLWSIFLSFIHALLILLCVNFCLVLPKNFAVKYRSLPWPEWSGESIRCRRTMPTIWIKGTKTVEF